ncbi:TIR domain-containing protein [Paenibacillus sp. 481]|uniref:TIR domain-containing protein n=1 Tax=Paenibacillus sp. 481 TaxID=2835869 RepID=UPI001E3D8444|nr:TIR domain-containing protein [Paenibacillus sp. 481]UHA72053.1 nucleotide-binding protein [Paenibacillus sp. 481]
MDTLLFVRETIKDIDESKLKLSLILQKCKRIAFAVNDFRSLYWIVMELVEMGTNDQFEKEKKEIVKKLRGLFEEDELEKLHNQLISEYWGRRKVQFLDKNNNKSEEVCTNSIYEIENHLETTKMKVIRNDIPDGMHTLDLYYAKQKKDIKDDFYSNEINSLLNILERIKSKIYGFLIEIENKLVNSNDQGGRNLKTEVQNNKNVFIIHGHNEARWRELEKMLKEDFNLEPIILQEKPDGGATTIIDKFEAYASTCSYAFAIFTPDDIVESNGKKYVQARPNVVFELGWFSAMLGRRRVCILMQEGENMDIFSDFQGVMQKRFYNSVSEVYRSIKLELEDIGMI